MVGIGQRAGLFDDLNGIRVMMVEEDGFLPCKGLYIVGKSKPIFRYSILQAILQVNKQPTDL